MEEPIFDASGGGLSVVSGKIVHLLACEAAIHLGKAMVKQGCLAFFGYDTDFGSWPGYDEETFECDSEIDLAFADGLSAAEVYDRVKNFVCQTLAAIHAKGGDGANRAASTIETNFVHLACPSRSSEWGEVTAKVK